MIARKQNIKKSSEEVSLQVSFTESDIKKAMMKFFAKFADTAGNAYALTVPLKEQDIIQFLENDTFALFVQKYREPLAAWAFEMALRHKYILPSNDSNETKKTYFFSEVLKHRIGRPKLLDDE